MKCYYFEKNKICKYGKSCPYAHSDSDLKTPEEMSMLSNIASQMNAQLISNNTNINSNKNQMTPEEYQRKLQEQSAYYYYNNPQLYSQYYNGNNDISNSSDTNFGNGNRTSNKSTSCQQKENTQETDMNRFQSYQYEGKYYYYDTQTGYSYPYTPQDQEAQKQPNDNK